MKFLKHWLTIAGVLSALFAIVAALVTIIAYASAASTPSWISKGFLLLVVVSFFALVTYTE